MSEEYVKISPEIWKPLKEDDEIAGMLVSVDDQSGKYKGKVYHIETEEAKQMVVFGTVVLDDKMKFVDEGDHIKIVFKGKKQGEKGGYNVYEVFKKELEKKE